VEGLKFAHVSTTTTGATYKATPPDIRLHCDSEMCGGVRSFQGMVSDLSASDGPTLPAFVRYLCRNCRRTLKLYAVQCRHQDSILFAYRIGELPLFGPPTPKRLAALVEEEREYYLKGRRAQAQSMAIASFAYYRCVVENQRDRIFDAIIKVARQLRSPDEMIDDLEAARKERQFSKAVAKIKHGIPPPHY
jgi:hypothetical protein